MAANTSPIFSKVGATSWVVGVTTANTTTDLTAGTIYLVFTADATNGGYVDQIIFQPLGTNVDTVGRVWFNTGATTGVAANNTQFIDVSLAATTLSQTTGVGQTRVNIRTALPAGYRIYVTLGTTVATGFAVTATAGTY